MGKGTVDLRPRTYSSVFTEHPLSKGSWKCPTPNDENQADADTFAPEGQGDQNGSGDWSGLEINFFTVELQEGVALGIEDEDKHRHPVAAPSGTVLAGPLVGDDGFVRRLTAVDAANPLFLDDTDGAQTMMDDLQ